MPADRSADDCNVFLESLRRHGSSVIGAQFGAPKAAAVEAADSIAVLVANEFAGTMLYVPRSLAKAERNRVICAEIRSAAASGRSSKAQAIRDAARRWLLTERTVYQILEDNGG